MINTLKSERSSSYLGLREGYYKPWRQHERPEWILSYDEMHENLGPRWVHGYCYALSEGATEYLIFKFILS